MNENIYQEMDMFKKKKRILLIATIRNVFDSIFYTRIHDITRSQITNILRISPAY